MTTSVWDPEGNSVTVNADSTLVHQQFTATQGQSEFTISNFSYVVNTGSLIVVYNGAVQTRNVDFEEISGNVFRLLFPANAGDIITAYGFVGITASVESFRVVQNRYVTTGGEVTIPTSATYLPNTFATLVFKDGEAIYANGVDYNELSGVPFIGLLAPAGVGEVYHTVVGQIISPLSGAAADLSAADNQGLGRWNTIQEFIDSFDLEYHTKQFTVPADGITNATAAIIAADAAVAANGGGKLIFDPGTYLVSNNLLYPSSNVFWYLERGAIIQNVNTSDIYNIIIFENVTRTGIDGPGRIIGHTANNPVANAICVNISGQGCDEIYIGPIEIDGSNGECIFVGSGGGAAVTRSKNIFLNRPICKNARRNGIAVGEVEDVVIFEPYIDGVANPDHVEICSGIDIEPIAGQLAKNVTIIGGTYKNTEGSAITCYGNIGGTFNKIENLRLINPYGESNCTNTPTGTDVWPRAAFDVVSVKDSFFNNLLSSDHGNQGGASFDLLVNTTVDGVIMNGRSTTGTYPTAAAPTQPQLISSVVFSAGDNSSLKNVNVRNANYHGVYLFQNNDCDFSDIAVDKAVQLGVASESNVRCKYRKIKTNETQISGVYSINDTEPDFGDIEIIDANASNITGVNIAGSAMAITTSGASVCESPKINNVKIRTPSSGFFQPTYAIAFGPNVNNPQMGKDLDLRCVTSQAIFLNTPSSSVIDTELEDVLAVMNAAALNVTGNGTLYQLVCDNKLLDRNNSYNAATGVYTARRSGKRDFHVIVGLTDLTVGATVEVYLRTTLRGIWKVFTAAAASASFELSVENFHMNQGDTAVVEVIVSGVGADTTDIYNGFVSGVPFYATSFSSKLSN